MNSALTNSIITVLRINSQKERNDLNSFRSFQRFYRKDFYVQSSFFMPKMVLKTAPSIFGFKTITFITVTPYFLQRAKPQNTNDIASATMMNFVGRMKEITKPSPSDAKMIPAHEFLLPIKMPPADVLLVHYIQGDLFLLLLSISFPNHLFQKQLCKAQCNRHA